MYEWLTTVMTSDWFVYTSIFFLIALTLIANIGYGIIKERTGHCEEPTTATIVIASVLWPMFFLMWFGRIIGSFVGRLNKEA